ncbi:LysR family transcriptional regulator [Corallococcus sp. ZKHCc1 1396]|uniref:LysR family transcriptional regulator n=1 Tax=Corallococcus soli TaxID=2710757 RepID=A0ABR9PX59_9BACT|nr:LysR family transcriptional regulator [Corallococcus soli]MBE4752513.1 LysR family transcriptional regulator [Corallococcus soli]
MSSKTPGLAPALDLNGLARFAAVVEHGGFSAAARVLGLPRQVVHRSVAGLEATAGTALLERSGGRVRVTDAGQRLWIHAAAILSEARAARANMAAARSRPRGRLRLTAPHLFAEHFLGRSIQDFLLAWPDVEIDASLTVARNNLIREELDLAIRLGPRPSEPGFVVSLGTLGQTCCASPAYLARAGTPTSPHELGNHALALYGSANAQPRLEFQRRGESVSVAVRPRLRIDSARVALSACRAGVGIAWLPEFLCADELESRSLVRILPDWELPRAPVWAFSVVSLKRNATLRAFVELVQAHLSTFEQAFDSRTRNR